MAARSAMYRNQDRADTAPILAKLHNLGWQDMKDGMFKCPYLRIRFTYHGAVDVEQLRGNLPSSHGPIRLTGMLYDWGAAKHHAS